MYTLRYNKSTMFCCLKIKKLILRQIIELIITFYFKRTYLHGSPVYKMIILNTL